MLKMFLYLFLMVSCHLVGSESNVDWKVNLPLSPGCDSVEGSQILHTNPKNKPFWNSEEGRYFVKNYLMEAIPLTSDAEALKFGSDHVKLDGLFMELGVWKGRTINFIAALNPHKKIYGFDSFEGLPEDWVRGDKVIPAEIFKLDNPDEFPLVLKNVKLVKGWFCDTLPRFIEEQNSQEPIAFLHIDSDIYSSAVTAFEVLGDRIKPGTILVFDELYNYPGYENHEFKAFQEFLAKKNLKALYLAYNIYHEQVVVEIAFDNSVQ